MILNIFIRFINRVKTSYISCTHYPILHFSRKYPASFAAPLIAQDTSKLTGNRKNTSRCTTQSNGKGENV